MAYRELDYNTAGYVGGYYDGATCRAACGRCHQYGRSWSCPPFDYEPLSRIASYSRVRLVVSEVAVMPGTPVSDAGRVLSRPKQELEQYLLSLERELGGLACTTIGRCPHCGGMECARLTGRPCRHPELVRPSLEAFGFDLNRTMTELLGISLRWGRDGMLPDTLCLIGAVFY